jgi:hypothetical protein
VNPNSIKTIEEVKELFYEQKYSCCQLIAAINAAIFLGLITKESISDEEYERMVDLVSCRYGSALGVEKVYPQLGIVAENGPYFDFDWIRENLPVEVCIIDVKTYGFHSVLIVGCSGNELYVANSDRIKTKFTWEEFLQYKVNSLNPHNLVCRTFKRGR